MANGIILLGLALALGFGVRSYAKKLAHGCCGAGGDGPERKVRVADKSPAHYAHAVRLGIGGMTCASCARRVENALNGVDGVWAQVNLRQACALVRMKTPEAWEQLSRAVAQAGYSVTGTQEIAK